MTAANRSLVIAPEHGPAMEAAPHLPSSGLLDLRRFWLFLRRRAGLVLGTAVALMACAVGALMVLPAR